MCGCTSLPASDASVRNRWCVTLALTASFSADWATVLIATSRLANVSRPSHTLLVAPSPILRKTSYLPILPCPVTGASLTEFPLFAGKIYRTATLPSKLLAHDNLRQPRRYPGKHGNQRDGQDHQTEEREGRPRHVVAVAPAHGLQHEQ